MTIDEAIETIKYILKVIPKEPPTECDNIEEWLCEDDEIRKALDIAIKSLEQTIDKEKMIEELEESLQKANATLVDGKQKPCEDCVSRKAVLNTLDFTDKFLDETRTVESYKTLLEECYKNLPSVTPTRKKGKWIGHGEHCENLGVIPSGLGAYEWCSNCDCGIDVREWHRNHYNYCPNCGTKMDGGRRMSRLIDVDKIDWQKGVFVNPNTDEPLPIIHKIATIEMLRDWQEEVKAIPIDRIKKAREEIKNIKKLDFLDTVGLLSSNNDEFETSKKFAIAILDKLIESEDKE